MNNKIRTTLLGGLLSASIASPLLAGDFSTPIQVDAPAAADMFSFSAGYHSTYVFRGVNFGDDMVDWSLEASKTAGSFDLTAGVWQANVISNGANADLETDFYASASKDLGFASLEFGYIFYYFDGATAGNTQEVYLGLSKDVAGFALSANLFYDFDLVETTYLELGASKSLTLGGQDFDAALVLGLNPEDTEVTHVQATVSKSIELNSEVSVTPYVSYSYAVEDIDSNSVARDDEFVAGVSVGFSF
jgi:uncharacterized protein (TIGR02001 family)